MSIKSTLTKTGAAMGFIAAGVLVASPAFAEGSFSSSISGANPGFSSRSWQDSQLDNISTTVSFSGCSTSTGPDFQNASLNMYDEHGLLPDASIGTITNSCDTSDWGNNLNSDGFHFTVDAINGLDNYITLEVSNVDVQY
ncbi:hypothetical protein ITJ38_17790 [Agreia pratensis]|uniref:hypothetical protein n=1 Tax=Agreia pratensis TaxID=150121 RepID=UPI001889F4D6|nr:hypothetical protein [Agreia pratensis]MBF4636267.1 hypothetical protein [Agreia pratensis]